MRKVLRSRTNIVGILFVIIFSLASIVGCSPSISKPSSSITTSLSEQDSAWPAFGQSLANQRFVKSNQINRTNVKRLARAWTFHSGVKASFQTTPIVVAGVMYVSLPFNHVVALDAKTGQEIWRYQHQRREGWNLCCGPANRGVAVADGKVYIGTVDARLIALDSKTGEKVWDIDVVESDVSTEQQQQLSEQDPNKHKKVTGGTGVGIAMAPVVYHHKVIIGITGVGYGLHIDNPRPDAPLGAVIGVAGRYGRPGFLAAFDTETGKRVWQFDTIPAHGWEGAFSPTTPDGIPLPRDVLAEKQQATKYQESARFGGGSAWSTPAIDEETHTLYFGTGNPSPQMNDMSRPGDNLYTVSLVALNADTGQLQWYYQQVPHDVWGYDLASPPVLFEYEWQGHKVPAVAQASKTGWLYIHHRQTGALLKKSDPFVPQHQLFTKATFEGVTLYPGILGGANWSPIAIDARAQTAYVAAIHAPIRYTLHETPATANAPAMRYASSEPAEAPRWGVLSAIDLTSGKIKWQRKTEQPLIGGVLATAGHLLFFGEGSGAFNALDTATGETVWSDKHDAGVNAPPVSYVIDGVQYIAVAAGGNAIFGYPQGDELAVYQLK